MRVPEVQPGESVVLTGYNFFNVDARVRLTSKSLSTTQEVQAFVMGDRDTAVREMVNGVERIIADGRVHDSIAFRVPTDIASDIYGLTVIVPNDTSIGLPGGEYESQGFQYIRVVPPATAKFQISATKLKCEHETSPACAGSDEVGIKFIVIPVSFSAGPGEKIPLEESKFSDLDSGEEREMNRALFSGCSDAVSMALIGFEIDNEEAYKEQVEGFGEAFELYITSAWSKFAASLSTVGSAIAVAAGLGAYWATAIASLVTLAIGIIFAIWAPADLVIEDPMGLTSLQLDQMTNANFPPPPDGNYRTADGIDVRTRVVAKMANQCLEERVYRSSSENSRYCMTLQYTRLS